MGEPDETGRQERSREEGVLGYREVVDVGPLTFVDLLKRGKDVDLLCDPCSTFLQRPTRHSKRNCLRPVLPPGAADGTDKEPPASRICGPQVYKKPKKAKAASYPCKVPGCNLLTKFRKIHTSNLHMHEEHLEWVRTHPAVLYPAEATVNVNGNGNANANGIGIDGGNGSATGSLPPPSSLLPLPSSLLPPPSSLLPPPTARARATATAAEA
jgi:hypothetical protein